MTINKLNFVFHRLESYSIFLRILLRQVRIPQRNLVDQELADYHAIPLKDMLKIETSISEPLACTDRSSGVGPHNTHSSGVSIACGTFAGSALQSEGLNACL